MIYTGISYIASKFQEDYAIKRYDLDAIESDWISDRCSDVRTLLTGFFPTLLLKQS